jgi:hypothetical protein
MGFPNIAIILRILFGFFQVFMQFLEISRDFGILGFSKILGFFQRFFGIFDEVYEDFQSNLPLDSCDKVLGLIWDCEKDLIKFDLLKLVESLKDKQLTKRNLLSTLAKMLIP